jgi:myo-inositol-1(or 4)-monophosphatase
MTFERELEVAKRLARSAGKALRSFDPKKVRIGQSARSNSMVTIPDLVADDIIISGLQLAFPDDALCSEHTPLSYGRSQYGRLWLVDALDGNMDFLENGDQYAVSIGLAVRGQAVLGVVYNPVRDELFAGTIAQPTTINGLPASATRTGPFADAHISMPRSEWAYASSLLDLPPVRPGMSTSYELARVAAGMEDGFFSVLPVSECSTCAGVALVNAGGGRATFHGGLDIVYDKNDLTHPLGIVAACTAIHEELNQALTSNTPRDRGQDFAA